MRPTVAERFLRGLPAAQVTRKGPRSCGGAAADFLVPSFTSQDVEMANCNRLNQYVYGSDSANHHAGPDGDGPLRGTPSQMGVKTSLNKGVRHPVSK